MSCGVSQEMALKTFMRLLGHVTQLWGGGKGLTLHPMEREPQAGPLTTTRQTFCEAWPEGPSLPFSSLQQLRCTDFEKKEEFGLLMEFRMSMQKCNSTIQGMCPGHLFGAVLCVRCWEDAKWTPAWLCSQGAHRPVEETTIHPFTMY